jgi:hypothetical protein
VRALPPPFTALSRSIAQGMIQNRAMSDMQNPFDSIESAQDFMGLLSEAIEEAIRDVEDDRKAGEKEGQERRVQALNLALYKLKSLNEHVDKGRRILKDLRSIRRLLVGEQPDEDEEDASDEASADASGHFGV